MPKAPTDNRLVREHIATLVLDETLYPRAVVDENRIGRLSEVMRAGVDVPPLVAEDGRRRVIDGFHRYYAYLRVFGGDAQGMVEWRTYVDDAAAFKDAAALNAGHGQPLSSIDLAHCIQVARRFNISEDDLRVVLSLTQAKVDQITAERFAEGPDGQLVLLKRSSRHLAGTKLTGSQVEGNTRASGMPLIFHVNQVINALETGIAPLDHPEVFTALRHLCRLLPEAIGPCDDDEA